MSNKRIPAYRDGLEMWTEGEVFNAPGGEVIEILYNHAKGDGKTYFIELPGVPSCAHGATIEEAIEEAKEKRDGVKPITDEERQKYSAEDYKFSVSLFRRITRACSTGTAIWLKARGLDSSIQMTIAEFRKAGGGQWADTLVAKLSND